MQNNFEPKHLKKANEILTKQLQAAEVYKETNKLYKKEIIEKSLWEKILGFFKG